MRMDTIYNVGYTNENGDTHICLKTADCLEAAREVLNWDNINGYAFINKVVAGTVVYAIFCDKRKGTVRKSHVINTFNNSDMVAIATLFEAAYKRDRNGVK